MKDVFLVVLVTVIATGRSTNKKTMNINLYEKTPPEYFRDKEDAISVGKKEVKIPKVYPYVLIRDLNK